MDFRHLLVLIKSTGAGALSASSATHRDTHKHTSTKRDSLFPRGSALDATLLRAGTLTPPYSRHPRTRTRECRWDASALGSPALRANGGRVGYACMGMAATQATSASATTAAKAVRMAIAFVAVHKFG